MFNIDTANASDEGKFIAGTASSNPTFLSADWLNAVQEEMTGFIKSQGITLNKLDNSQLAQAISKSINQVVQNSSPIVLAEFFGSLSTDAETTTQTLQNAINAIVSNGGTLILPKGLLEHTGLIIPAGHGWTISGQGKGITNLQCVVDNVPAISFGTAHEQLIHSCELSNLSISYKNPQTDQANAHNLSFTGQVFHLTMTRVLFSSGYTGIRVNPGTNAPWGCRWDDLDWGRDMQGCAMDWSGSASATPNNVWGRFGIDVQNMKAGVVFRDIKGYNWSWQCLELFGTNHNQCIMALQAGSKLNLISVKQEEMLLDGNVEYGSLFAFTARCHANIGSVTLSGESCIFNPTNQMYIFRAGIGGKEMKVKIGHVDITPSEPVANTYLAGCAKSLEIDHLYLENTNKIPFTNLGGDVAAENLDIRNVSNNRMGGNKGDADYVVELGDPTTIMYETSLTADRKVTLPGANGELFNGMKYKIVALGKGTSHAITVDSEGLRATIPASADNYFVELMYRRHGNGGAGWKVIGSGAI